MLKYFLRRLLYMALTLLAVSVVTFVVIQLPPGDYLSNKIAELEAIGQASNLEKIKGLRKTYGLDDPVYVQYVRWMGLKWFVTFEKRHQGLLQGYLGRSFEHEKPVSELLAERVPLTMVLFIASVLLVYAVALPIGIYSATHKYTFWDYVGIAVTFIGMSVPGFLLALVLMFVLFRWWGISPGGLLSPGFVGADWSMAKLGDLLKHLIAPLLVVTINGTAGLIRVMRANLLDQLRQLYVTAARAKGLAEWRLLVKYPVRVAIIPVVSSLGFMLPGLIGGQAIMAVVLGLPTFGPLLLEALFAQDMYLAGSVVMIQTLLVVVGVFLSDMLLVAVDPRIRLTGGTK
ncbi:MAG: ABC transporter permease [Planctomycetota bacterium]|jgi:peptide/nickel transport system permease protein